MYGIVRWEELPYKGDTDRKKIQTVYEDAVVTNRVFDSREDAENFIIKSGDKYDGLTVAVQFLRDEDFEPSKKLKDLREKASAATKEYREFRKNFYFRYYQCRSISCKNCRSKLTLSFLHSNKCPVCGNDLRPQSALDKERWLKEKADKLNDECMKLESEERKNVLDKAQKFWLIRSCL